MGPTGFVFSEQGLLHDAGPRHPESPARLEALRGAFAEAGLDPPRVEATPVAMEDLLRVHSEGHVAEIRETCATNGRYRDPDTRMGAGSWDAALLAAGGAIAACRAVLDGAHTNVFHAMRPPGHHAERDEAMGFCLFNNVAVAARWLREVAGLDRVAILDWDVHHGNGTQHAFYGDASVYYASLHQSPHYPGTGRAEERGEGNTNLNVPLPPGTPAAVWLEAVEDVILPEFERFDPDFLLISCGFDGHRRDPLADQLLEEEDYAAMTRVVKGLAGGRVVSLLEGGYDLDALGKSAVAHFRALSE